MATQKNKNPRKSRTEQKTADHIQVSNIERGSAAAVGRGAKAVVINIFGEGWKFSFIALALALLSALGYFAWKWYNPEKMTGEFRIAVAGFETIGDPVASDIGNELSRNIYQAIKQSFSELEINYGITIWGPDRVGLIRGNSPEERSESARQIADKIDANIVVYGVVDATDSAWQVSPEFFIASLNFFQIEEITGQYQLGQPLTLVGQENAVRRFEINSNFAARTQALSFITVGLFYFSIHDNKLALDTFVTAETIDGWEDDQGKQVLYLLMGNAATGTADSEWRDLDAALAYLNKSLEIDPDYARPLITLAGVYYLKSQELFEKSKDPGDIDQKLLEIAKETYEDALRAKNQPPLSDITVKARFGFGQIYLMQAYGGKDVDIQKAVDEFQYVIAEYGDGKNPRIRELAAEAHARMGLIYEFSGYPEDAAREYQVAASLLVDYPQEREKYQLRANNLKNEAITP